MRKVKTVLLWIVQIWAAAAFVAIGFGKFGSPFWISGFARWGYSDAFRIFIGVLEMTGGVLMAFPPTTVYAATLIDVVMIGALGTLLRNGEAGRISGPIIWIVIVSSVAYARRHRAWRPSGRRVPVAADTV